MASGRSGPGGDEARRLQMVLRNALTQAERDEARRALQALSGHGTVREAPAPAPVIHDSESLVIVLDSSGSMCEQDLGTSRLDAAKQAAVACARVKAERCPQDMLAVVEFNDRAWVVSGWRRAAEDREDIEGAIGSLTAGGSTDIAAGLREAEGLLQAAEEGSLGRIILLTDGHGGEPERVAERLKGRGAVIDVVGVGGNPEAVNEACLRRVASTIRGDNRYRFIRGYEELLDHFRKLGNRLAR